MISARKPAGGLQWETIRPGMLFVAALLLTVLPVLLTGQPMRDVAARYAPMARAFAEGDWAFAFHPRIPPLFPLFAGVLASFGLEPFGAAKLVASLCFALTVFPLYALLKLVFSRRTAAIGCCFYLFCPYLLRLAGEGLRENAKMFALIWAVWAVVAIWRSRRGILPYLALGTACAWMILVRDDSVLFAGCFLTAALCFEIAGRLRPWRSIAAGGLMLLLIAPYLCYNWRVIGYPVPGIRFAILWEKVFPPRPASATAPVGGSSGSVNKSVPAARPDPAASAAVFAQVEEPQEKEPFSEFLTSVGKGIYLPFALPALWMVFLRLRRRRWSSSETVLFCCYLGHTVLLIAEILVFDRKLYVSRRYLLPAAPLAFGWTALAAEELYRLAGRRLSERNRLRLLRIGAGVLAVALYLDALGPQIKGYTSRKHRARRLAVECWAPRIREDYRGPERFSGTRPDPLRYRSFRRPLVACDELPALGYLSGGEGIWGRPEALRRAGVVADYLVCEAEEVDAASVRGYELWEVRDFSGVSYALYRRGGGRQ